MRRGIKPKGNFTVEEMGLKHFIKTNQYELYFHKKVNLFPFNSAFNM